MDTSERQVQWKAHYEDHKKKYSNEHPLQFSSTLRDSQKDKQEPAIASLLVLSLFLHVDDRNYINQVDGAHHCHLRDEEICFVPSTHMECGEWCNNDFCYQDNCTSKIFKKHIVTCEEWSKDNKYTVFPYQLTYEVEAASASSATADATVPPSAWASDTSTVALHGKTTALVKPVVGQLKNADETDALSAKILDMVEVKRLYKLVTGVEVIATPVGAGTSTENTDDRMYATYLFRKCLKIMSEVSSMGQLYHVIRTGIMPTEVGIQSELDWNCVTTVTNEMEANAWMFKETSKMLQGFSPIRLTVIDHLRHHCIVAESCRDSIPTFVIEPKKRKSVKATKTKSKTKEIPAVEPFPKFLSLANVLSRCHHPKKDVFSSIEKYWKTVTKTTAVDLVEVPVQCVFSDSHSMIYSVTYDDVSSLRTLSFELSKLGLNRTVDALLLSVEDKATDWGTLASLYNIMVYVAWETNIELTNMPAREYGDWENGKFTLLEKYCAASIKGNWKRVFKYGNSNQSRSSATGSRALWKRIFGQEDIKLGTQMLFSIRAATLSIFFGHDKTIATDLCDVLNTAEVRIMLPSLTKDCCTKTSTFVRQFFICGLADLFNAITGDDIPDDPKASKENRFDIRGHSIAKLRYTGAKKRKGTCDTCWFDTCLRRHIAMSMLFVYKQCGLLAGNCALDDMMESNSDFVGFTSVWNLEGREKSNWPKFMEENLPKGLEQRVTCTVFQAIAFAIRRNIIKVSMDLKKGEDFTEECTKDGKMKRTYTNVCQFGKFEPKLSFGGSSDLPPLLRDKTSIADIAIALLNSGDVIGADSLKSVFKDNRKQAPTTPEAMHIAEYRQDNETKAQTSTEVVSLTQASPDSAYFKGLSGDFLEVLLDTTMSAGSVDVFDTQDIQYVASDHNRTPPSGHISPGTDAMDSAEPSVLPAGSSSDAMMNEGGNNSFNGGDVIGPAAKKSVLEKGTILALSLTEEVPFAKPNPQLTPLTNAMLEIPNDTAGSHMVPVDVDVTIIRVAVGGQAGVAAVSAAPASQSIALADGCTNRKRPFSPYNDATRATPSAMNSGFPSKLATESQREIEMEEGCNNSLVKDAAGDPFAETHGVDDSATDDADESEDSCGDYITNEFRFFPGIAGMGRLLTEGACVAYTNNPDNARLQIRNDSKCIRDLMECETDQQLKAVTEAIIERINNKEMEDDGNDSLDEDSAGDVVAKPHVLDDSATDEPDDIPNESLFFPGMARMKQLVANGAGEMDKKNHDHTSLRTDIQIHNAIRMVNGDRNVTSEKIICKLHSCSPKDWKTILNQMVSEDDLQLKAGTEASIERINNNILSLPHQLTANINENDVVTNPGSSCTLVDTLVQARVALLRTCPTDKHSISIQDESRARTPRKQFQRNLPLSVPKVTTTNFLEEMLKQRAKLGLPDVYDRKDAKELLHKQTEISNASIDLWRNLLLLRENEKGQKDSQGTGANYIFTTVFTTVHGFGRSAYEGFAKKPWDLPPDTDDLPGKYLFLRCQLRHPNMPPKFLLNCCCCFNS